jgi:hypothetical protein
MTRVGAVLTGRVGEHYEREVCGGANAGEQLRHWGRREIGTISNTSSARVATQVS